MNSSISPDYFVSDHQNVIITSRIPHNYSPKPNFNFSKITFITSGIGLHVINGKSYAIYPRMLFFTQSTDLHIYEHTQNLSTINIFYQPSDHFNLIKGFEALIPKQFASFHIHRFLDSNSANMINGSLSKLIASQDKGHIEQESLFLRLLVDLRYCSYFYDKNNTNERRILRLIRWLHANFQENVNWTDLASQFSITIRTMHRYLDKDIGLSPQRYLNKLRLFNALYQLLYTNKAITSIAQDNGFDDHSYFTTCFRREFGVPPRAVKLTGTKHCLEII
ncbi:helix-turn-helix domain-containing protein [Budvicia diplopodorum]|uniref:helix-turn-helix domain-containing protein n=1 Tax=Budvicia diplopodorum TaxID=1119056 RepID=UPI0013589022|nr:helix-turn-helix domain-containing protein [Budvicia diplopodorum]